VFLLDEAEQGFAADHPGSGELASDEYVMDDLP